MGHHIVVTGCAGFIGSHLVDRLLADGNHVTGIDSFTDYYARSQKQANLAEALAEASFSLIEADVAARDGQVPGHGTLADAFRGAECVYHLAAQAGVRTSWGDGFDAFARDNVLATQRVLEACVAAGVPRVVYTSSSSVYGDQPHLPVAESARCVPRSPYGVTKLAGEQLCGAYDATHALETVSLRLFTVYGPRQRPDMAFHRFIRDLHRGQPIDLYGDGTQTRDFTYVGDIVEGLVRAAAGPAGSVFNLGGGRTVSLAEAIETLGVVLGVRPVLKRLPASAGDVHDTWADIGAASATLGWTPSVTLLEGLRREWEWLAAL